MDDGLCDILKCGAEFCEGAGVIGEMGVGVYLSTILIIFSLDNPSSILYNIIKQKQKLHNSNFPLDKPLKP